jgi:hypothetical protein
MAHGAPDYSNVLKEQFVERVDDMAELVARLTDLASLQRGGEVVMREGFDNGLRRWNSTLLGTGASFKLDNVYTNSGPFSARLTGGSDGVGALYCYTVLPYLEMSTFGYECRMAIGPHIDEFDFFMVVYTGSKRLEAKVLVSITDSKIYYLNSGNTYTELASGVVLSQVSNAFNFVKITVNGTDEKYSRLTINSTRYGLSTYDLYTSANATTPYMLVGLTAYSDAGENGYMNIDNVFVTRNEP